MNERKFAKRPTWPGVILTAAMAGSLATVAPALAQSNEPARQADHDRAQNRIEELIVTATRLPRTIENIAGTVSLITSEQIEREVMDDLDDLARFQPGVSVSTASRGGNQGFSIRGMGGNRVLTIIDGIRGNDIFEAGPASYGRDSIETENIKRVELIRGPASVLYGADAIGGAVILTSKQPRDYLQGDRATHFSLRASSADADSQNRGGFSAAFQGEGRRRAGAIHAQAILGTGSQRTRRRESPGWIIRQLVAATFLGPGSRTSIAIQPRPLC